MTRITAGLSFLALMGALGGCNLLQGGREVPGPSSCANPLFGPETPGLVCQDPRAMRDELLAQADEIPPEDLWDVGETGVVVSMGANGMGPTLGFARLPGFPEHRFLVYNDYRAAEGIFRKCPLGPAEDCYERYRREYDPGDWITPVGVIGNLHSVLSNFYPVLVGKGGSTEAELEWITQYWGPRDLSPLRDPFDYQRRMETDPDPNTYKTYTYRRTYRAHLAPGRNVRVELGPFRAERAPQYDSKPIGRGYNLGGVEMAEYWRWPLIATRAGWTRPTPGERERLYALQFYWENQAYYAFQEASGNVAPPTPICQPGMGYRVRSINGFVTFRNKVFPYDRFPLEYYQEDLPAGVMPYSMHTVLLVGQDVIHYYTKGGPYSAGYGFTPYFPLEFHPKGYPGYTRGRPEDLARYPLWGENPPGRTFRLAVLYRFTIVSPDPGDWRPHPSHPLGEDNWHIVWSDVRLAGTKDNPDCSVEAIGYHMYDESTSRALDSYFGLEEVSTASVAATVPMYRFYSVLPVLTRLSPNDASGYMRVPVGSVRLPNWALPPGW